MRYVLLLLLLASAAQADELDALSLADRPAAAPEPLCDWRGFAEAAGASGGQPRPSLDVSFDRRFAPGWRAVLADRLDINWPGERKINTLKEAYLAWQPSQNQLLDAGRINARFGVASGYNPSDFLRGDAVRSVVSPTPGSLRENRLGVALFRGQTLWDGGSLTAIVAPRLAEQPSNAPFSPDWGASNRSSRWLLAASQQLVPGFSPQWLLFGGERQSPQLGLNASALLNDATLAYVEWSGGHSASLLDQAQGAARQAFHSRLASGLSYTTANKLSVTAEYHYNGAAPDAAGWNALRAGPPGDYWRYRAWVSRQQDPATRHALFWMAQWQDAGLPHLDLTALHKHDWIDHTHMSWLEARYHWSRAELALQWQRNQGSAGSVYGALAPRQQWQTLLRYYF